MNDPASLLAGAARRVIDPPQGIYQIGYGDRTKGNLGIHDNLTATALVLQDGRMSIAIVALDMLTINEFIVDRIRARLAPIEVLLCCSHTHSGPIAYADGKSRRSNREYIDALVASIVEAVQAALANLQPARLEYSQGEANVGINRREKMPDGHMEIGRNPEGVRDKSVQVVSVLADKGWHKGEAEGTRIATLVNYACHGTVLGPDNRLISADWIGVMRDKVESDLGGLALFLQGAAADINPDMFWGQANAFEMAAEQGSGVAKAVLAATLARSEKIRGLPIQIERVEAWMPTEVHATTSKPPKSYAKPLLAMAKIPGFMTGFVDILLNQRYPWKPVLEAKDGFWAVPMRINAVRIGDLALVMYAAETFTEIGIKIKSTSPAVHTMFASVSDGCISYLHTEACHAEGGYEVDMAPLTYRYPGRLQAKCEGIALGITSQMLKNLWNWGETEKPMSPKESNATSV